MKKIIALVTLGAVSLFLLSGCGIWADEEAPTEVAQVVLE